MRRFPSLFAFGALAVAAGLLLAAQASAAKNPAKGPTTVARAEAESWVATLMYPDDDRDLDRRFAALRLGIHRQAWALDTLIRQLRGDRDPAVRAACAYSVGRIGGDRAVGALVDAITDPVREVRTAAIEALDGQVNPYVAGKLEELSRQGDGPTALAAARVLEAAGSLGPGWIGSRQRPAEPAPMPATTGVYVDPAAGDDANKGYREKPVRTIRRGLALLQPGDALMIAGLPGGQPIREPVLVPASLSGEAQNPTRILAWPGRPRPVISPTRQIPAAAFASDAKGIWRTKTDFRVFGAFVVRSASHLEVLPMADSRQELKPGMCWFDAAQSELTINFGDRPLPRAVEAGFAQQGVYIDGAHDVVVQDLDVRFAPDSGFDANASPRVAFVNCTASYCDRHGFFFYYSPHGTVRGCRASYCAFQGVSVRASPETILTAVQSTSNGVDGILFLYDSDGCLAVDSVATGNFRGVSFIEGSTHGRVIGGDYTGNKTTSVSFESGSVGGQVIPPP